MEHRDQSASPPTRNDTSSEASLSMDLDQDAPIATQVSNTMSQDTSSEDTVQSRDNDFIQVNRKQKRQRLSNSADEQQNQEPYNQQTNRNEQPCHQLPTNNLPPTKFPAFLIQGEGDPETYFDTAYELTRKLETERPHLKIRAESAGGKTILIPMDQQTYDELNNNPLIDGQPVPIQKIDPQTTTRKLILQGYPQNFSMRAVLAHAQVVEATRCNINGIPTKQILITLRGPIPTYIDLKTWGTYSLRPYTPEPLRCFNCQNFGHHQSKCYRPTTCGICSGRHNSRQCIDKLKAKQSVTPKCPNCSRKHHAWNKACPARKSKVQQDKDREEKWVQERLIVTPAPQGTFNWWTKRDEQTNSQSPVNLNTSEFPPLPPPASQQQQPPLPQRQPNLQRHQRASAPTPTQTTLPTTASVGTQTNQDMTTQTNMETSDSAPILVNKETMMFLARELSITIASFLSLQLGKEIHTDGIQACAEAVVTKIYNTIQNPADPKDQQTPRDTQNTKTTQQIQTLNNPPQEKCKKTKRESSQETSRSRSRQKKRIDTGPITPNSHSSNRDPRFNRRNRQDPSPQEQPTCPHSQQTQQSTSSSGTS